MPGPDAYHGWSRARAAELSRVSGGGVRGGEHDGPRQAIPIASSEKDASAFSLTPLLDTLPLPSLAGISSLKGFLPSPTKASSALQPDASSPGYAHWQEADIDGLGEQPLLIVCTPSHALRVFRQPRAPLLTDPHAVEDLPPAVEIVSIPRLVYPHESKSRYEEAHEALIARDGEGAFAVMLVSSGDKHREWAVLQVGLADGAVRKRVALGRGSEACMRYGGASLCIAMSNPTVLHVLNAHTLDNLHPPIVDLPVNDRSLPIADISGRLLAYVTDVPPRSPGPHGLGSIVTARAPRRVASEGTHAASASSSAIISSAVGLGGVAARGVLAGLRMGARAANQARASRLARSAPVEGSFLAEDLSESRSLEETSPIEPGPISPTPTPAQVAHWVMITDVRKGRTVAHFRLPSAGGTQGVRGNGSPGAKVALLSFSPDGTQLAVAQADGRACHILQVHGVGEVLHLYELMRGNTAAAVQEVVWDRRARWIGLATGRGTIHVFPIHPAGTPASASSHVAAQLDNPESLPHLSTVVNPVARLRHRSEHGCSFLFLAHRRDPLKPTQFLDDVAIARSNVIELVRLDLKRAAPDSMRRGSALTELMRRGQSDLEVGHVVKARWILPEAADELVLPASHRKDQRYASPLAHAEIRTYSINPHIVPGSIYLSHQVDFFSARAIDEYAPLSIMDREARQAPLSFRADVAPQPSSVAFDEPLSSALHTMLEPHAPEPAHRPIPGLPNGTGGSPTPRWASVPIRQVSRGVGEGIDRVRLQYARAQAAKRRRRASEVRGNALSFEEDTIFAVSPGSGSGDGEGEALGVGVDTGEGGLDGEEVENETSSSDAPLTHAGSMDGSESWGDREWYEDEYRRAVLDEGPDDLVLGLMDEEEEERRARGARLAPRVKRGK